MRRVVQLLAMVMVLGVVFGLPAGERWTTTSIASAASPAINGDINCDATVTATDILAGLHGLAGFEGADCAGRTSDVNCSGATDIADIMLLRRYVAGLTVTTPQGCTSIGDALPAAPSTDALIDAALEAGTITKGEALLYHVYADLATAACPLSSRATPAAQRLRSSRKLPRTGRPFRRRSATPFGRSSHHPRPTAAGTTAPALPRRSPPRPCSGRP